MANAAMPKVHRRGRHGAFQKRESSRISPSGLRALK
jgi:hypothetical protein